MNDAAQRWIDEGYAAHHGDDLSGALRGYEAAVAMLRGMDAPPRLAHSVRHVADIQCQLGELPAAQLNYSEALEAFVLG